MLATAILETNPEVYNIILSYLILSYSTKLLASRPFRLTVSFWRQRR